MIHCELHGGHLPTSHRLRLHPLPKHHILKLFQVTITDVRLMLHLQDVQRILLPLRLRRRLILQLEALVGAQTRLHLEAVGVLVAGGHGGFTFIITIGMQVIDLPAFVKGTAVAALLRHWFSLNHAQIRL